MTHQGRSRPLRNRLVVAGIALAGVLLDALSKNWAVASLGAGEQKDVIGSFVRFSLSYNDGMAFSAFRGGGIVLSIIAATAIVVILWYAARVRSALLLTGLGLICGGAAGNLADRIVRAPGAFEGNVVDFIALPHWPTFNVADMLLFFGVGCVILATFRAGDDAAPEPTVEQQESATEADVS